MQLKKLVLIAISCQLLAINLVQAVWEESQFGPPTCSTPDNVGCALPINAEADSQTKNGNLNISGDTISRWFFVTDNLNIGDNSILNPMPTSTLDVDGQVRIRGPLTGPNAPANAKVLAAVDGTGLAHWISDSFPIDQISSGFGISTTSWAGGIVAIDTNIIQRTLPNTACDFKSGVYSIDQNSLTINCRPFVTSITLASSPNGLTLGGIDGARSLSVNLTGGGLATDASNNITVTDTGSGGTGLKFDGTNLRFDNYNCNGTALYWQSTGPGTWTCMSRPAEPPGGSILFLASPSSSPTLPLACPTSPDVWIDLGIHVEASGGVTPNNVRKCYHSTKSCQVLYIKHNTVPVPSCPSGWVATPGTGSQYNEYVNGLNHFSRACTLCH